jgi:hypothetical protein
MCLQKNGAAVAVILLAAGAFVIFKKEELERYANIRRYYMFFFDLPIDMVGK